MEPAAAVSLVLGILWSPLLYWGIRHRSFASIGVVLWAWMAQLLIAWGHVTLGRALSVPWVLVLVTLLIERLLQRPEHVARVASAQVTEARQMAHDEINDAMAKFARELVRERTERDRLAEELRRRDETG